MPRLIWSPAALRDVERLHRFLASKNRPAAQRAIRAIRRGIKLLANHPHAGRAASDMPPDFREWPIAFGAGGYIALYRQDGETVVILAVRHGREGEYKR
jgi:plasmid stabilization system protein ParE